jgi:heme A synthase
VYTGLQHFHSFWAYIALLLLILTIGNSALALSGNKPFAGKDRKLGLYTLISVHIQFLIGILLLFTSPYWTALTESGMGEVMKNSLYRMMVVEHPLTNIIAITLITIGWSRHKKQSTDKGKHKSFVIFYLLGIILLLSRIPYGNWWS